ncbi:MAG: GIY-YIG nuclease family protein [Eudoraea sp.]|nr:GIY-YIG nuclease family protein [Eudoraea sp.]
MCFVYVLYSPGFKRFYVGSTINLDKRVAEHNRGKTKSTRPFKPWKLVFKESFGTIEKARKREKYLKTAAGRRWRSENIKINKGD